MDGKIAIEPETLIADEDLEYVYVSGVDIDTLKRIKLIYRLELVSVQDEDGNELDIDIDL